jgi:hypothetical protein
MNVFNLILQPIVVEKNDATISACSERMIFGLRMARQYQNEGSYKYVQWSKVLQFAEWLAILLHDHQINFAKRTAACKVIMENFDSFGTQSRPWYADAYETANWAMWFVKDQIQKIRLPHQNRPDFVDEAL